MKLKNLGIFSHDSTVGKLILLFIMEKMEIPLTETSIVNICTGQNDWLNYMECKDVFFNILESNFIYRMDGKGNETRYALTVEGQSCLANFYQRIPENLREEITEFSKNNRLLYKRSQEYLADYSKNSDGSYTVFMKIKSSVANQSVFEMRLNAPSRESAIEACKKWREKAYLIYEGIYENLLLINE